MNSLAGYAVWKYNGQVWAVYGSGYNAGHRKTEQEREEMAMTYDFLVVGAGLFGSVFAHEAAKHGKRVSKRRATWKSRRFV